MRRLAGEIQPIPLYTLARFDTVWCGEALPSCTEAKTACESVVHYIKPDQYETLNYSL